MASGNYVVNYDVVVVVVVVIQYRIRLKCMHSYELWQLNFLIVFMP